MARRYEDEYERDVRDRRPRDPRDLQRERDSRDRMEPREQRRLDGRESDRMDYPRDGRSDLRATRDAPSRSVYAYPDRMERDDVPSRAYMDDGRERLRPHIDLQSQRREESSSRYQEYFLPGEDINREVIQYDICRYLGNDATVRPVRHSDGRQGYLIRAYRAPTTAMIATLKRDSKRFEQEQELRRRQYGQSGSYGQSATFEDRQRQGRPDVRPDVFQSGYAGYPIDTRMDTGMDTGMDTRMDTRMDGRMDSRMDRMDTRMDTRMDDDYDYDDDHRRAVRGYRDAEPRMNPRLDPRLDPRQQLPTNRHAQMPPGPRGYPQDPPYPQAFDQPYQIQPASHLYNVANAPRPIARTPPPPTVAGVGQGLYSEGYPTATSLPAPAHGDPVIGRPTMGYQAGSGHPGWGDTPNFGEGGPRA